MQLCAHLRLQRTVGLLMLAWALACGAHTHPARSYHGAGERGGAAGRDEEQWRPVHREHESDERGHPHSHSCIHDEILEQRRRAGTPVYTVTPQVYDSSRMNGADGGLKAAAAGKRKPLSAPSRRGVQLTAGGSFDGLPELGDHHHHHHDREWGADGNGGGRGTSAGGLEASDKEGEEDEDDLPLDRRQPIRIFLNYDAVGHSLDRDCRAVGEVVKLGEPPVSGADMPMCNPRGEPPVFGDCWYNCTTEDISEGDKQKRLHEALGETAEWFKNALSVEPVRGPLRLSGYSACGQDGGVQLPRQYVDEGVMDADLVLLVTTRPTTGNTLAWAVACERDQWGRAIAGHVNVAPRHLTAEAETLLSATLIHEVMHVLGFDPHAFAHFRDERKRRRSEVVSQHHDPKLGRMVTRVILPRVVMHSRQHYGAFSEEFKGLELEDGGGRGTAGSHWEKRLLMNEIMTGSVDTRSVVSAMTLALLEDSGWYRANFSMAEQLDWGRHQGVQFVTSRCDSWMGAYRCNSTAASGCTFNREAEGYCPIVRYNGDLPSWARYFSESNKGGQSSLADYCAYYVAYSDGSCIDSSSARAPDRMLGEMRGTESRCMASSLVRTGFVRGTLTQGNGCYQHQCINGTLKVAVDDVWRLCPLEGGPVDFPGFNGELICPAYRELCADDVRALVPGQCPGACSMNGECVEGTCRCFLGFEGIDCSQRTCPGGCSGHGLCSNEGVCECYGGYTGVDCSTMGCDEQCSLHGGVCDDGVCDFRCSDYAGYTCQNSSGLISSLSLCGEVLASEQGGQHCAPSEAAVLQQLESAVVMPNYNRLVPSAHSLFRVFDNGHCEEAAKRLACWISIQRCDGDGDNRLRVCHSACTSYNSACSARLDCTDRTLFSGDDAKGEGQCTGDGLTRPWWQFHVRSIILLGLFFTTIGSFFGAIRHLCFGWQRTRRARSPPPPLKSSLMEGAILSGSLPMRSSTPSDTFDSGTITAGSPTATSSRQGGATRTNNNSSHSSSRLQSSRLGHETDRSSTPKGGRAPLAYAGSPRTVHSPQPDVNGVKSPGLARSPMGREVGGGGAGGGGISSGRRVGLAGGEVVRSLPQTPRGTQQLVGSPPPAFGCHSLPQTPTSGGNNAPQSPGLQQQIVLRNMVTVQQQQQFLTPPSSPLASPMQSPRSPVESLRLLPLPPRASSPSPLASPIIPSSPLTQPPSLIPSQSSTPLQPQRLWPVEDGVLPLSGAGGLPSGHASPRSHLSNTGSPISPHDMRALMSQMGTYSPLSASPRLPPS